MPDPDPAVPIAAAPGAPVEYLSLKSVVKRYDVSRTLLNRMRREGRFPPPTMIMGYRPLWSVPVLDEYDAKVKAESAGKQVRFARKIVEAPVGGAAPIVDRRFRRTGGKVPA
jgi:predicted DNA-binding transcriptional regulator AlpA